LCRGSHPRYDESSKNL